MPKSTRWRLSSIGSLLNRCLAVGILLIFVACGSDESKTVTTATTAMDPLNACELVTSEDAQKLLDEPATKSSDRYPMNRTSPDGKTWFSTCGYTGSTSGRDISIMVRYADALTPPKTSEALFEELARAATAINEDPAKWKQRLQAVSGIGDVAAWDPELSTLTSYSKQYQLVVFSGHMSKSADDTDLARARAIVNHVIRKL